MDLSISAILAGFIFSIIGLWLFREGKRRSNIPLIVISIVMMAYSYFTKSPWQDWGFGLALCGGAYYFWYH